MLKFGFGIVLDGLPDIPEFHFFSDLVQILHSYLRNP